MSEISGFGPALDGQLNVAHQALLPGGVLNAVAYELSEVSSDKAPLTVDEVGAIISPTRASVPRGVALEKQARDERRLRVARVHSADIIDLAEQCGLRQDETLPGYLVGLLEETEKPELITVGGAMRTFAVRPGILETAARDAGIHQGRMFKLATNRPISVVKDNGEPNAERAVVSELVPDTEILHPGDTTEAAVTHAIDEYLGYEVIRDESFSFGRFTTRQKPGELARVTVEADYPDIRVPLIAGVKAVAEYIRFIEGRDLTPEEIFMATSGIYRPTHGVLGALALQKPEANPGAPTVFGDEAGFSTQHPNPEKSDIVTPERDALAYLPEFVNLLRAAHAISEV